MKKKRQRDKNSSVEQGLVHRRGGVACVGSGRGQRARWRDESLQHNKREQKNNLVNLQTHLNPQRSFSQQYIFTLNKNNNDWHQKFSNKSLISNKRPTDPQDTHHDSMKEVLLISLRLVTEAADASKMPQNKRGDMNPGILNPSRTSEGCFEYNLRSRVKTEHTDSHQHGRCVLISTAAVMVWRRRSCELRASWPLTSCSGFNSRAGVMFAPPGLLWGERRRRHFKCYSACLFPGECSLSVCPF